MSAFALGFACGAVALFVTFFWWAICTPSTYDRKLREAKSRIARRKALRWDPMIWMLGRMKP